MGASGSNEGDAFDRSAKESADRVYAETGDNFKSTEAAVAEYSKKAFYDSGSDGPMPESSIGGNVFDAVTEAWGIFKSSNK